jgi:hypothetical protein
VPRERTTSSHRRRIQSTCANRRAPGQPSSRHHTPTSATVRGPSENWRSRVARAITPARPVQSSTKPSGCSRTVDCSTTTPAAIRLGQDHVGERIHVNLPTAGTACEQLDAGPPRPTNRVAVDRGNSTRSIASLMPIASNSLPQLGGRDTARPRLTSGRVMSWTSWPHFASKSDAAAPAARRRGR